MNILKRMSTGKFVIVGVLIGCILLVLIRDYIDSPTIKYKMSVYVDTPQGLKVGSAVREMHFRMGYAPFLGRRIAATTLYGAAVAVDLGNGRAVFATLNGGANSDLSTDHAKNILWSVFPTSAGAYTVEGAHFYRRLRAPETELKIEQYPMVLYYDPQISSDLMEMYENNYVLDNGIAVEKITIETAINSASLEKMQEWWSKISSDSFRVYVYRNGKLNIEPGRRLRKNFGLKKNSFISE
ncbi:MAG TPA: hypothetical protein VHP34_06695 [Alphaproteobacteria bacterium]|jgi:hypothetical protein|nr:hypothetical protein [Alphaproteobacteria bacterium]